MDAGVAIGWVNTALMAVAGGLALARWRRLRWFPVYALIIPLLALLGRLFWYNHDFYLFKDHLGNLLLLLAVAEAWRVEAKGRQWWVLLVLPVVLFLSFYPLPLALRYQLPQEPVLAALVLMLPRALKIRSPVLTGWAFFATFILLYDAAAALLPELNWPVLQLVYPLAFLAMDSIWLWALLQPERERLLQLLSALAGRLKPARPSAEAGPSAEAQSGDAAIRDALYSNVFSFPANINDLRGGERPAAESLRSALSDIRMRLDVIEEALGTITRLSLDRDKVFLSRPELAIYLGSTEEVAERFVEFHRIKKIRYTAERGDWAVFTADVNEALGIG